MKCTPTHSETSLALLKADLGFFDTTIPPALEVHLGNLLDAAYTAIARGGLLLVPGNVYDDQLQAMYAAWLYRKSRDGSAKPPMLQHEIRDRQVAKALEPEENT